MRPKLSLMMTMMCVQVIPYTAAQKIDFPLDLSLNEHFDTLPSLAAPKASDLHSKLDRYLGSDPEFVSDVLAWWFK